MRKLVTALIFATLAGSLTFGAAAALNVNAQNLGSGGAEVTACQENVDFGFAQVEDEPQLINGIVLTGITSGCDGQTVSYIVSNDASESLASGEGVLSGADEQTFLFEGEPLLATDIGEVGLTIAGLASASAPVGP